VALELSREAWVGLISSVVLTIAAASSAPWWWHFISHQQAPVSAIVGMSGGCAPFQVFAQNRWRPYGAAIREQPNVLSDQIGSFPGNMSISVNGWVNGRVAYTTNTPPWNNAVWFHLTDGVGWVSFAGVRATPVTRDPTGLANGGPPAQTSASCEGAVQ